MIEHILSHFVVDKLVQFFDTFTLVGIFVSCFFYCFWKKFPSEIETLYCTIIYTSIVFDLVILIGSLSLNLSFANFQYQIVYFVISAYITFVQFYGVLVFYETLDSLNVPTFLAGVAVLVIHQLVFGSTFNFHLDLKQTISKFLEAYFGVKDNAEEVLENISFWCLNILKRRL